MSEPTTQDIPRWRQQVAQLQRVQFGYSGSRDKQMVFQLARTAALAESDPTVTPTPNEVWWLERLCRKYRMQIGRLR